MDEKSVVIVGAGFGGLRVARSLGKAPARVILIDRNNYHLFQPLLYQVATAGLEPEEIAQPVRAIVGRQKNLEFRLAEVKSVDLERRSIRADGMVVGYDYLVLAVGAETDTFGNVSIAEHSLVLKGLDDAVTIRNHVLRRFERALMEADPERRRALLSFVIVGGGPTGVEMAGALSELIRLVLAKDYRGIHRDEVRVTLLEAQDRLLPGLPLDLAARAEAALGRKGVQVRYGAAVERCEPEAVVLAGGEKLPAETVLWAAGAKAVDLVGGLGIQLGSRGRARVGPDLTLPGHPEVFVIGDAAYLEAEGRALPMMAPVAIQMADSAADNILRQIAGRPTEPFRYQDPGGLATIGRNAAVAHVYGLKFHGFVAWVVWLIVHLIQLIGFRNRLLVLVNWAWDYLFYDRAVRLITATSTQKS
ncbi:MAG TPA: NAD(P)/FAD-dependent oxidoreductase [Anaerolineales bacterium]|nr:NAD(P)/FAD-dependent oxidoreductase [Anaerolineales bacterium]